MSSDRGRAAAPLLLSLLVSTAVPVPNARAGIVATGGDVLVSGDPPASITGHAAAGLPGHGYVVMWVGQAGGGSATGLASRFLGPEGIEGPVLELGGQQEMSNLSVSALQDGVGYVAVWQGVSGKVRARLFDTGGGPVGGEFDVGTGEGRLEGYPDVAAVPDGFVVVWEADGAGGQAQPAAGFDIFARRFDRLGAPLSTVFRVNSATVESQLAPAVAARADGSFVVAWEGYAAGGVFSGDLDVFARRFDAAGLARDPEFAVNTYTTGRQRCADAALDLDGRLVIAWHDAEATSGGASSSIRARGFDVDGAALSDGFRVDAATAGFQYLPRLASLEDGTFVVAWTSAGSGSIGGDGSGDGIHARRVAAEGAVAGAEFLVNGSTTGDQRSVSVGAFADGFLVTWLSAAGTTRTAPSRVTARAYRLLEEREAICGDPLQPRDSVTAADALGVLRAALAIELCELCVCDVNESGVVTATDALAVLRHAVGIGDRLNCPPCL